MNNMAQFDRNNPTAKPTQFNFTDAPANVANVNQSLLSSLPTASLGTLAQKAASSNYGGLLGTVGNGSSMSSGNSAGTNLTDAQWATVKQMRDEVGWNNPFDQAGLQAMMALGTGSPLAAIAAIKNQIPYLDNYAAMKAQQEALARDQAAAAAMSQYGEYAGASSNSARNSGESGWGSGGGLSLGDSNRSAISAANGYGGGV